MADDDISKDENGIEFKNAGLDQYASYDITPMIKKLESFEGRIGSLLITFSELEHNVEGGIAFILNDRTDDWGVRATMDMSYMQKVELFNRFCKARLVAEDNKIEVGKLDTIIRELRQAGRIRNIVAHAKWMSLDKDGFVRSKASMDTEAYIQFKYYRLTPTILYRLDRRIGGINHNLLMFLDTNHLI